MSNILLFRGSPRSNIYEVERWNDKLPCDVLNVRYAGEHQAYEYARGFFLNHSEYDYLAIATDDIEVKPEHILQLQKDLEVFKFPVISGMMNVDEPDFDDEWGNLNITYELAIKDRKGRFYNWVKRNQLPDKDIFEVKFAGFGLTAIRRDIIELEGFSFHSDGVFRDTGSINGASLDLVFCWFCHENFIPIYADKRIDMHHWRTHGIHQVGERKPEVEYKGLKVPFGFV